MAAIVHVQELVGEGGAVGIIGVALFIHALGEHHQPQGPGGVVIHGGDIVLGRGLGMGLQPDPHRGGLGFSQLRLGQLAAGAQQAKG